MVVYNEEKRKVYISEQEGANEQFGKGKEWSKIIAAQIDDLRDLLGIKRMDKIPNILMRQSGVGRW